MMIKPDAENKDNVEMKNKLRETKKGMSEIIAWILLLGFSISLAVIIFNWTRTHTEELTKSTVSFVEGKLECQEIAINVAANDDCSIITITNKGKLTIDQFAIRTFRQDYENTLIEATQLSPKQSKQLNILSSNKIEVIPIVKIKEKLIGCNDKRISNECT